MSLRDLLNLLYDKFVNWLHNAPSGALPVTGILGLALILYGFFQYRGASDNRGARAAGADGAAAGSSAQRQHASATTGTREAVTAATSAQAAKPAGQCASATPVGRAVSAQLSGIKRVTVSVPGIIFEEALPSQLQEAATVRPEAVEVLQEMSRISDVYLIAQVDDDVGQAVVTGALESAGLLGSGPGQVKAHHVLCCSTLEGKVPIVRQLEPDLHMDAHTASVEELKRFLPQLLLVREGSGSQPAGAANVAIAASLGAFFGLH